jgi:hypothetical protein
MRSLQTVEEFYGEKLTPELVHRIARTPDYQLEALAALFESTDLGHGEKAHEILANTDGGILAIDGLIEPTRPDVPLAHSLALKRALLYLDHIVVADTIESWAEAVLGSGGGDISQAIQGVVRPHVHQAYGISLGRILRGLLPLRELLKRGVIIPVPQPRISWRDSWPLSYNPTSAAVIVKYLWDKYKGFIPQGKTEPIDTSNYQDAALSLITHAEYRRLLHSERDSSGGYNTRSKPLLSPQQPHFGRLGKNNRLSGAASATQHRCGDRRGSGTTPR